MSEFQFKVGDLVYCPMASNKIMQVSSDLRIRYQNILGVEINVSVYYGGKWNEMHNNPAIFPATQEWYDKLVHVYPDLKKPPKRKSPVEIILAMVADWHYIPCRVSDDKGDFDYVDLISSIVVGDKPLFVGSKEWKFAVPFDPQTNKNIIDFVDGKIVLED